LSIGIEKFICKNYALRVKTDRVGKEHSFYCFGNKLFSSCSTTFRQTKAYIIKQPAFCVAAAERTPYSYQHSTGQRTFSAETKGLAPGVPQVENKSATG
jgi:hypothetical protein